MKIADQFEILLLNCRSDTRALCQVEDLSVADAIIHRLVADGTLTVGEIVQLVLNSGIPTGLMRELIGHYTHAGKVAQELLDALGEVQIGVIKGHGLQSLVFPLFGFDPANEVLLDPAICTHVHDGHPIN